MVKVHAISYAMLLFSMLASLTHGWSNVHTSRKHAKGSGRGLAPRISRVLAVCTLNHES